MTPSRGTFLRTAGSALALGNRRRPARSCVSRSAATGPASVRVAGTRSTGSETGPADQNLQCFSFTPLLVAVFSSESPVSEGRQLDTTSPVPGSRNSSGQLSIAKPKLGPRALAPGLPMSESLAGV